MNPRDVPLSEGDIRWMFPAVTGDAEQASITRTLQEADNTFYRAGRVYGAAPDAEIAGIPVNRFYYQRLGPGPDFPVTVLVAEGGIDPISTQIICTPRGLQDPNRGGPIYLPSSPWRIDAWITLQCDSDPTTCAGHETIAWHGALVDSATAAADRVLGAAIWMLERATEDTLATLRARDPLRGHAPIPRRRD